MSMSSTSPRSRILAAALATALLAALAGTSPAATARPAPAERAPAGPFGSTIILQDQASFSGLDVAVDPGTGTAYVGWIGDPVNAATPRRVNLCVLPLKATTCQGGIRTIDALDGSSAAGLHVEVTGASEATLVWFHQPAGQPGKLATATYSGGVLGDGVVVAEVEANGTLMDVVPGPGGQLWAVTRGASGTSGLSVRPGLSGAPQAVSTPWYVGKASLAFAGTTPMLLISEFGPIADPVYFSTGTPWKPFKPVPRTWSLGEFHDLVSTKRGVRMVSSENQAGYRPVVAKWKGSEFSRPRLIGETRSCPALSFDLGTDASGRLTNVSERCGKLGIYNHPLAAKAAITYFNTGGTVSLGEAPQIATTKRGYGLVAWAILSPTGNANKLQARWVRLPSLLKAKGAKKKGNKVTVKAPVGCLTPVTVKAVVKARPARGWKVVSRSLKLDGKAQGVDVKINGEQLATGSKHVLLGKGVFRKGGQKVTVKKKVTFKAC